MNEFQHPLTEISFSPTAFAVGIEASAGTGKTWTIERLFVKALLEKSSEPNFNIKSILVVTFTKAAAAELKARILKQIRAAILLLIRRKNNKLDQNSDPFIQEFIFKRAAATLSTDVTVLTRAAQLFDQASIFTIHSFCQQVLKDYSLDCKINLPFEVVGNNEEIISALVHGFYREEIINNHALADRLEQVITNIESLFRVDFDSTIIQKIYNKLPKDIIDIREHNYCLKYRQHNLDLKIFKEPLSDKLAGLNVLINNVTKYIFERYAQYRNLANSVSFDELIQIVADAIQQSTEFATKLYHNYPVAFIDEFQDTDIKQWTIFSTIYRLTGDKRGNVVVVGDPKQAIYRFRGADVDTYIHAVHKEIKHTKTLSENRRSHKNIMNFINQIFAENHLALYPNLLGDGIRYDEVQARADESKLLRLPNVTELEQFSASKKLPVKFYAENVQIVTFSREVFEQQDNKEDYILNAMTLEILALLHADPTLKGNIAILVTRNSEATKIVNFMAKFGIKASELKLKSIFATATAQELLNIIAAISDLSNVNKFNIAISGKIFNFELNKLINKELYQREFEQLYSHFFKYQKLFNNNGIMPLIYELIADIAERNVSISQRELANLFQLGEILHKNSRNLLNNYELLHWFNNKISTSSKVQDNEVEETENEELIRLDNDDDQIVITTQHKAKGLEFEILFCPYFKAEDKYFKKDGDIDGVYINNRMPRYVTEHTPQGVAHKMVLDNIDNQLGKVALADQAEIQRLNYVALTRAKGRLYIYLSPTKLNTRKSGYHHSSKTSAIHKLFGFNLENVAENSHPLFNYPQMFSNPAAALKNPQVIPGVVVYQRSIVRNDLKRLALNLQSAAERQNCKLHTINPAKFRLASQEQSYSALARVSIENDRDYYSEDDIVPESAQDKSPISYRYSILNGIQSSTHEAISGAKFGLLYHELCENYPLQSSKLANILNAHNIPETYAAQCKDMIEEAFNQPLFTDEPNQLTLSKIYHHGQYQTELEFNLIIKNKVEFASQISLLIAKYYGENHPYTLASRNLGVINSGFLKGFIDLFFEHDGKFWVLDYKTNTLESYYVAANTPDEQNVLLEAMAHHHYYLQFLLYLVATKRHLEVIYNLTDASQLLGGAIYMFVRGYYIQDSRHAGGIIIDDKCIALVGELDLLLGNVNE